MCGRLASIVPKEAMARMFSADPANNLPIVPNYNVCPTNQVAVVTAGAGLRRLRAMRWGFVPSWYESPTDGPLLINARAETIAAKPAFRAACRERRCLVPVSGFFEWDRRKGEQPLPWYVTRTDGTPLVLAGIWQDWERADSPPVSSCAIVTCAANADMAPIHDRLPVVLAPRDWPLWLGEAGHGAAALMQPAPVGDLRLQRVGVSVNSNRASGPELIEPLA